MPDVRAFMASGYFNGKIYLVGGYNTGNVDPLSPDWEMTRYNTFAIGTSMPALLGQVGIINGTLCRRSRPTTRYDT